MRIANRQGSIVAALALSVCGLVASAPHSAASQLEKAPPHRAGTGPGLGAGPDGRLFFTKTTADDVQTIYDATGHHERQLTAPGDYCCVLRASTANGRILVFPTADQIPPLAGGTLDPYGQDFRRLTPRDPTLNLIPTAWSPDGTNIAYLGWDEADPSRRGIYTPRADGRDLTRVTIRPGNLDDVPLDYSPDGHRLVFYRSAHPDPDPHTDGALWVVNVDGTRAHPITTALTAPADWARWSPDGRRIVFANERTSPTGALWTVDPSGSHLRRAYAGSAIRFPISPVWSPEGHRILFGLDPNNDQFTHPDNEIWSISDDGARPRLVDDTPDSKSQFDWLPPVASSVAAQRPGPDQLHRE
jgi:Tol biopolymer transport system component